MLPRVARVALAARPKRRRRVTSGSERLVHTPSVLRADADLRLTAKTDRTSIRVRARAARPPTREGRRPRGTRKSLAAPATRRPGHLPDPLSRHPHLVTSQFAPHRTKSVPLLRTTVAPPRSARPNLSARKTMPLCRRMASPPPLLWCSRWRKTRRRLQTSHLSLLRPLSRHSSPSLLRSMLPRRRFGRRPGASPPLTRRRALRWTIRWTTRRKRTTKSFRCSDAVRRPSGIAHVPGPRSRPDRLPAGRPLGLHDGLRGRAHGRRASTGRRAAGRPVLPRRVLTVLLPSRRLCRGCGSCALIRTIRPRSRRPASRRRTPCSCSPGRAPSESPRRTRATRPRSRVSRPCAPRC